MVQRRILMSGRADFILSCTPRAKAFLLAEAYDRRYGARPLKRAIERYLITPISNLVATRQIASGDVVVADLDEEAIELRFGKAPGAAMAANAFGGYPQRYGSLNYA
jgi:ATP-dependent Clp protease ATP-binding subunit ClpA